jgi:hypothetical protein
VNGKKHSNANFFTSSIPWSKQAAGRPIPSLPTGISAGQAIRDPDDLIDASSS